MAVLPDGGVMLAEEGSQSVWVFHSPGVEVDLSSSGIRVGGIAADRFSNGEPTLVKLSSFTADKMIFRTILSWKTDSEIDNAGFNIWRSESEKGEYTKINKQLIPAQGSPTQGQGYEFVDYEVQNWKSYFYKLEDLDLNGKGTFHGPKKAISGWLKKSK
jgi:hypothetical protein